LLAKAVPQQRGSKDEFTLYFIAELIVLAKAVPQQRGSKGG